MKISFYILCVATLALSSLHKVPFNSTTCDEDKLGKLITGTHQSAQPTQISESDCSKFLHVTVTTPSCTEYTTKTEKLRTQSAPHKRRQHTEAPYEIPDAYKSAYSSSVCSSLGITPSTTTVLAQPTTVTITEVIIDTSTSSSTSTTSAAAPTCTADVLNDPQNCGKCGHICGTGICEAGSCTDFKCRVQSCGNFDRCDDKGGDCYCFSSAKPAGNTGFCGKNAVCAGLTACANDSDCAGESSGNICAVSTCCPAFSPEKPGVCLAGQCSNPAQKLAMMSKFRSMKGSTAAF
ncbi:hypothetical protein OnM2_001009 [Erysiphe neolycopersici]|uniref:Antifreeze protein n=1 Tax=Erysiphe neolycopersici TaxID=212602 RepID=A0A420I8B7_9PEZI|nr:hypothetical protein OnM2_001009 [Erysiphe neolycopersici]